MQSANTSLHGVFFADCISPPNNSRTPYSISVAIEHKKGIKKLVIKPIHLYSKKSKKKAQREFLPSLCLSRIATMKIINQ